MDYIEVKLIIQPYTQELAEILMAELGELGFESFSDTESGFDAYIPANSYSNQNLSALLDDFYYKEQISIKVEESLIKAQNWNALWESNFEPIVIDNRCTVRAPFHTDMPMLKFDIVIEPKMSFGTGHHATTYLVAEWLLDNEVANLKVLDMGCGTGILAILAALKNAQSVDAIDIDEWAYTNAIENVRGNNVSGRVTVLQGDAALLQGCTYHVILANINRNILLQDMAAYTSSLEKGGTLVVSGIFTEDVPAIANEAVAKGLKLVEEKSRNKWARAVFVK